ncbi:two pore domain potassium channel family protein [Candidatus Woesearchaeota archaeon]|nr:two pore domain potassium channel family protein [Candidatus Woesearchaeota archaeon]
MDIKLKIAVSTLLLLLVIGTTFYHFVEEWSLVDSFYFTSITLTTIGYGDVHPVKDVSKIFTSFFAILGVAVALYALTIIGSDYFARREQDFMRRMSQSSDDKSARLNLSISTANQHLMKADQHIVSLMRKIDERLKK